MNISDVIATKVVEYYSDYDLMHEDLLHTQEVVTYTRMIAVSEGIDEGRVTMLESAAWLHDIGCPQSKQLYGNSLPENQQKVGRDVTRELLSGIDGISQDDKKWLEDVVGSHHQFKYAETLAFQPLFEADLIVNILSGYYSREQAPHLYRTLMRSESGKRLFNTLIK